MMLFLLDANTLSDISREHPRVRARLAALATTDRAVTSVVSAGEVLFGIERMPQGQRRTRTETKVRAVLSQVQIVQLSPHAAREYAMVKRHAEIQGKPVADNDLWIAAAALVLKATLVTRDTDFQHIPNLSLADWSV